MLFMLYAVVNNIQASKKYDERKKEISHTYTASSGNNDNNKVSDMECKQ